MAALDMMHERPETNRVIKVLDHPARKRIIELLGARGAMPWKDLAAELGMGTGALYYHIDTLEGIVSVGSYLLSLGALILTSYLATVTIFHDRPNLLPLAASSSLSFLPVVIFSLALSAISSTVSLSANRDILTVALVIFQAWSATILAAGISVSSSVRIEKSIMASLIVLYTTMILVFVLGSGF